ncbi:exported hypothetical protein [Hyphomicrobium sp. GJ21]|uniref:hypothetical protein n=1 Tax=Hyphomicrobium sp. GJ21 TaxID=113574 RepID=UPI000622C085|nr:hypothetical protein [Hyphomicrobium sp. GJ21]CEJ87909.1 exported hypothetical protein [Hyphomicrobium sp. GJ21]
MSEQDKLSRRKFAFGSGALALMPSASAITGKIKAPPIVPPITLEDQINNVKRGWTADGLPALHTATSNPENVRDYCRVSHVAGTLLRDLDGKLPLDDRARTLIISKCIHHISLPAEPETLAWLCAGLYLARNPDALFLPLTLYDYAAKWDSLAEALEREEQQQTLAMLEAFRAEMCAPPPPVLWTDGSLEFVKLTHPFHVFESGYRSLAMLLYLRGEDAYATNADEIRLLSYWLLIQKGCCLIYSLRHDSDFNHAATIIHTPVRTVVHTQHDEAHSTLAEIAAWMRLRHGPRHFMATKRFRDTFLSEKANEACLPWGPDNDIRNRITAHTAQDGWRIRARRPAPIDG